MRPISNLDRLPKFAELLPRYLEKYRHIKLIPHRLVDRGMAVTLMPARAENEYAGKALDDKFTNMESLPVLELKSAGIEWDRREETIMASVAELLDKRSFTIRAADEEIFEPHNLLMRQFDAMMLMASINIVQLKGNLPLARLNYSLDEAKQDVEKAWKRMPCASVTIEADGELIPGLDLSKPFEAWRGIIVNLLIPGRSPEYKALMKAVDCWMTVGELIHYESRFEKLSFASLIPHWIRNKQIGQREKDFETSLAEFETAMLALA